MDEISKQVLDLTDGVIRIQILQTDQITCGSINLGNSKNQIPAICICKRCQIAEEFPLLIVGSILKGLLVFDVFALRNPLIYEMSKMFFGNRIKG